MQHVDCGEKKRLCGPYGESIACFLPVLIRVDEELPLCVAGSLLS